MARYRLGFTGDVMLGRLVDEHQRTRPPARVWGDLLDHLRSLDGLFINLECCVSTRGQPWEQTYRPFHFRANPDWAIPALSEARVDFAALANNHLVDFGAVALLDTLDHLDEAGIAHAGAGRNRQAAIKPAVVEVDGLRVGLLAFTDNTPEYAADEDSPGVAYADIAPDDESVKAVFRSRLAAIQSGNPDLVVASLHWGPNMVERPPETFQRFARWLVTEGVDVLHGHSAHVFQGIEIHDGAIILYDCGDFVDDYAVDGELRNDRSFLFEMMVTGSGAVETLRLVPTEIEDYAVHQASKETASWSLQRMQRLSRPFGTEFISEGDALVLEFEGASNR